MYMCELSTCFKRSSRFITMGRAKLPIKLIRDPWKRNMAYVRRRAGLMKKVYELATLCDVDVALVMFTPQKQLTAFCKDGRINEVMSLFESIHPNDISRSTYKSLQYQAKIVKHLALIETKDPILTAPDCSSTTNTTEQDDGVYASPNQQPDSQRWDPTSNFEFGIRNDTAEGQDSQVLNGGPTLFREFSPQHVPTSLDLNFGDSLKNE